MNGYTRNIAIVLAAALTLAGVFATTVLTARADTPQDTSTEASGASLSDATLAGGEDIAGDAANSTESDEAAPLVESETLPQENPYGLAALWAQGDLVAKGTLMILAIMSVGSWYILFTKLLEQRSFLAHGRAAHKRVAQGSSIEELTNTLSKNSAFLFVAQEGLAAKQQHARGLGTDVSLIDWIERSQLRTIDGVGSKLQGGLAFLATVGSTAPFVGLFGTVWGIYHALIAIGIAGQASLDKVAGPVGEALIMTAIGLAVAVPAVLGYNLLVRRNKAALEQVRRFATEVEVQLVVHK